MNYENRPNSINELKQCSQQQDCISFLILSFRDILGVCINFKGFLSKNMTLL